MLLSALRNLTWWFFTTIFCYNQSKNMAENPKSSPTSPTYSETHSDIPASSLLPIPLLPEDFEDSAGQCVDEDTGNVDQEDECLDFEEPLQDTADEGYEGNLDEIEEVPQILGHQVMHLLYWKVKRWVNLIPCNFQMKKIMFKPEEYFSDSIYNKYSFSGNLGNAQHEEGNNSKIFTNNYFRMTEEVDNYVYCYIHSNHAVQAEFAFPESNDLKIKIKESFPNLSDNWQVSITLIAEQPVIVLKNSFTGQVFLIDIAALFHLIENSYTIITKCKEGGEHLLGDNCFLDFFITSHIVIMRYSKFYKPLLALSNRIVALNESEVIALVEAIKPGSPMYTHFVKIYRSRLIYQQFWKHVMLEADTRLGEFRKNPESFVSERKLPNNVDAVIYFIMQEIKRDYISFVEVNNIAEAIQCFCDKLSAPYWKSNLLRNM